MHIHERIIFNLDLYEALAQIMAWHQTGVKLSPEPMVTHFTDTHISSGPSESILSNSVVT